jgi:hypothetical protein
MVMMKSCQLVDPAGLHCPPFYIALTSTPTPELPITFVIPRDDVVGC